MAVTSFDDGGARYHVYYGRHTSQFDVERLARTLDLRRIDAVVIESAINTEPTDERQFTHKEVIEGDKITDLTADKVNHIQAYTFAARSGYDIWVTDVPMIDGYEGIEKIMVSTGKLPTVLASTGLVFLTAGSMKAGYSLLNGDYGLSRREFIMSLAAATPLVASGLALSEYGRSQVREAEKVNKSLENIHCKDFVALDDPDRLAIAKTRFFDDIPEIDLRDVVNSVKIKHLASKLGESLGRKPQLLLVYGSFHSARMPDYILSEQHLRVGINRWRGRMDDYLKVDWLDRFTLRRKGGDGRYRVSVFRSQLPSLGLDKGLEMLNPERIVPNTPKPSISPLPGAKPRNKN